MKKQGFQFKQFFVAHDRCAMKVNTDGILLGAIANATQAKHILDIGTGSGLIALMLAQRTAPTCHITALEYEENAYQQAVENAQLSAWKARISVLQGDVLQSHFETPFDLIVSNPPYFTDSLASRSHSRDLARHATQSHLSWLLAAANWITPTGKISFILPYEEGKKLQLALQNTPLHRPLYCIEQWDISSKTGQSPKRMIVTFSLQAQACVQHQLTIYDESQQYSQAFIQLTKDFYLKM